MSDTPRNKVNILEICQAKATAASKRIDEAKEALKSAEGQVSAILRQQQTEISIANTELTKLSNLIQDNEKEGIDTQKLEKKAADTRERISRLTAEHSASPDLVAARLAEQAAHKENKLADKEHALRKSQVALAKKLEESFKLISSHGAVEALEYETLDEALDEYVANIPMIVSISKAMTIDRVGLWQAPCCGVSDTIQYNLSASNGRSYRYIQIPNELRWLKKFPNTKYTSMPEGTSSVIISEGVPFLVGVDVIGEKPADKAGSKDGVTSEWMGKMNSHYKASPSIYLPDGISNPNRSGLCYIRSESKFYAVLNKSFPMAEMVPGKIKKKDHWGNSFEEDGLVTKQVSEDMSLLLEGFFAPVEKRIEASAKGFSELDKSEDPLVKRAAKAVRAVGVLDAPFEVRVDRLTGAEIEKEVGAYWDAFVSAPWEGALTDNVAMIKHLCERKLETPHVWSYHQKGHYGLRVRTRDHDWIVAEIYCPPSEFSPKEKVSHDSVVYLRDNYGNKCNQFIQVGACFINVRGREKG